MNKKLSLKLISIFLFLTTLVIAFSFLNATPVNAQCICDGSYCSTDCVEALQGVPCNNNWDCSVVSNANCALCSAIVFVSNVVVPWVFGLGVAAAIIFLGIGAIRYMTAGDDEKKIADAKGTVTWSVIGLIVIILAAAIIRLIWLFFGFEEGKLFLIPLKQSGSVEPIMDCSMCGPEFQ